jgi:hypothetical protein
MGGLYTKFVKPEVKGEQIRATVPHNQPSDGHWYHMRLPIRVLCVIILEGNPP